MPFFVKYKTIPKARKAQTYIFTLEAKPPVKDIPAMKLVSHAVCKIIVEIIATKKLVLKIS